MKKLKFIYLVLLSFGLMFLTYSADVDATSQSYEYYIEPPFEVPSDDDFAIHFDEQEQSVEGYWNFVVSFELEEEACLDEIKVDVIDEFCIEVYLEKYGDDYKDEWFYLYASDYFDDMIVSCNMVLYYEGGYVRRLFSAGRAYEILASDYTVFEDVYTLYPAENLIYQIDFEFEIDFDIDLTEAIYDFYEEDVIFNDLTSVIHHYQIGLYYNTSIYYDAYHEGHFDGASEGYNEGYNDGYGDGYREGYDEVYEYDYYIEPPFTVPPHEDWREFDFELWIEDNESFARGNWNFVIPFVIEGGACLENIKVDVIDSWLIKIYLIGGAYDWLDLEAFDYFDEMTVNCVMKLHDEVDYTLIDLDDYAYEILTDGIMLENVYTLYPAENLIYQIDFEFEIEFDINLSDYVFDTISDYDLQYQIELYYNTSIYREAYLNGLDVGLADGYPTGFDEGYDKGYDEGYDEGYDDGLSDTDTYQRGFIDGQNSKLAENNEAFYNGIEKWLVPAIITVIVLGGFVTIAVNKRRQE